MISPLLPTFLLLTQLLIPSNYVTVTIVKNCQIDYQITINGEFVKSGEQITIPVFLGKKIEIQIYGRTEDGPYYESEIINLNKDDYNLEFDLTIIVNKLTRTY